MKLSLNKLKRQKGLPNDKTVLFVCVENAGRSQMAEGFFRKYAPRGYMTLSAGTKPSGDINPLTIDVMKEVISSIFWSNNEDEDEDEGQGVITAAAVLLAFVFVLIVDVKCLTC